MVITISVPFFILVFS